MNFFQINFSKSLQLLRIHELFPKSQCPFEIHEFFEIRELFEKILFDFLNYLSFYFFQKSMVDQHLVNHGRANKDEIWVSDHVASC